ncbi:MAG: ribulose-phosphate 3-epimerase [Candidatus Peregrinibacteria bacterium Greene0416_19]|nr:MAG: ribulose-phosphate 3-epimerase [Candidatus Peregrinibacteria bacterium Greene0416_19]
MSSVLITASILAADLGHLQSEVESIEGLVDWIQADVMDGHFVPNLTFGAPIIRCLKTNLPFDIHLMVSNPADRLEEFLRLGVQHITFHAEAIRETEARRALIDAIHAGGAGAGIALNPQTPVPVIDDVVLDVDLVLVMSVQPGFAGQSFQPAVLEKVRQLRAAHPGLMIQMDGGIDASTAPRCIQAGATNLVSASHIFGAADRAVAVAALRSL